MPGRDPPGRCDGQFDVWSWPRCSTQLFDQTLTCLLLRRLLAVVVNLYNQ